MIDMNKLDASKIAYVANPFQNATMRTVRTQNPERISSEIPDISTVLKLSDGRSAGIYTLDDKALRSAILKYQRLLAETQQTDVDIARLDYAIWMSDRTGVSVEHAFHHAEDVQRRLFEYADNVSVYDGWKYFREYMKKSNWEEQQLNKIDARFEGIYSNGNLTDEQKEAEYEKLRQEYVKTMNEFPSFKHAESWVPTKWLEGVASTIPYMTKIATAAGAGALMMGLGALALGSGGAATPIVAAAAPMVAATAKFASFGAAAGGFAMSKQLIQNQHTISRLMWEDEQGNHLDPRVVYWSRHLSSAISAGTEMWAASAIINSIGKFLFHNALESSISASLWRRATQGLLLYGKGVAVESFEEGLQKITEDVTDNLAKWVDSRMNGNKWDYVGFKDVLKNSAGDFLQSVPTMMTLGFLPFVGATTYSMATAKQDAKYDARVYFDITSGQTVSANSIINPVSDYDTETVNPRLDAARNSRQKLAPIKVVPVGQNVAGRQVYRVVEGGEIYQGLYERGVRQMQVEVVQREQYVKDVSEERYESFERTVNDIADTMGGTVDIEGGKAYIITEDSGKAAVLRPEVVLSIENNTSIPGETGRYGVEVELDVAGEAGKVLIVSEGTWAADKLVGNQVSEVIEELDGKEANTKPLRSVLSAIYRETRNMSSQDAADHIARNSTRISRQLDKLGDNLQQLESVIRLRETLEGPFDTSKLSRQEAVPSETSGKKAAYEMTPEEFAEQAEQLDAEDELIGERKKATNKERAQEKWEKHKEEEATEKQKDHAERLQQHVDSIDEQVGTKTTVVPRAVDLPIEVAKVAIENGLTPSDVRAVFYNGMVYINAEQSTSSTIEGTWAHEWVAHRGLRALFGESFASEMEKLFDRIGEMTINVALPDYLQGKDKATRAEEYLAQKAEKLQQGGTITSQEMGFIEKAVDLLRRFLRVIGIKIKMSDAEIRRLLAESNDALGNSVTDVDGKMTPAGGNPMFQIVLEVDDDLISEMPENKVLDTQEKISAHNAIVEAKQILLDAGILNEDVLYDFAEAERDLIDGVEVTNLVAEYLKKAGEKRTIEEIFKDHEYDTEDPDTFSPDLGLFEWAILSKGVTDDINEAGYVLPDGTMLDFSGKREGGPGGKRIEDHRQLNMPIKTDLSGSDLMIAFQKMGAMRVDANTGLIDLQVMPSSEQMKIIKDLIEMNDEVYVDLQDGSRRASITSDASANKVIGQIRRFYQGMDINNAILFQQAPPTDSKAFKQWFGDSKVVDESGNPMIVYHGTNIKFEEFDSSTWNKYNYWGEKYGGLDRGFFFSNERATAERHARGAAYYDGGEPVVVEAFVSLQNPYIIGLSDEAKRKDWDSQKFYDRNRKEIQKAAAAEGYDGIIVIDDILGERIVVAFSPTQIKSVNNQGTWDTGNPNILFQIKRDPYAKWEPEITSTGVIKGAPSWVVSRKDLLSMRRLLRRLIKEGVSGRFWYEESAQEVWKIAQGDPVKAEKLIKLLAIYSPRNTVQINTIMAIRAYSHWAANLPEVDLHSGMDMFDDKAKQVLYHDADWEGRKTESFYINLMHELVKKHPESFPHLNLSDIGTMDIWMARAFGYDIEAYSDDKGTGKYSFSENSIRRLAAEMNASLQSGEKPWTTHQVQAAIWSAVKTRYELKSVIDSANKESLKKGFSKLNDKGEIVNPNTGEAGIAHRKIYRRHALEKAGSSEEIRKIVEEIGYSFKETLQDSTQNVTWEVIPSPELGYEILDASPDLKKQFTREAMALVIDVEGNDTLANEIGIPLHYVKEGEGGYKDAVSPNIITSLLSPRTIGKGASTEKVRLYASAIQYIFKQNAVPFFKFKSMPMASAEDKSQLQFKVVKYTRNEKGEIVTRTTLPKSIVNTQAEAEVFMDEYVNKHPELIKEGDEKTIAVHGGKYARALVMSFENELTYDTMEGVLEELGKKLEGVGFTRTAANEITITNFRDGETSAPYVHDELFLDVLDTFIAQNKEKFGILSGESVWVESEYGYDHEGKWGYDPQGEEILHQRGIAGQPDLQSWVVRRRSLFEKLLEQYSGENLRLAEERIKRDFQGVRSGDVLFQLTGYHGTAASFKKFDLEYAKSGEGTATYGFGVYLSNNPKIADSYRQRQVASQYQDEYGPVPYGNTYQVEVAEDLHLVDYFSPLPEGDYARLISALQDIDDDYIADVLEDLDPNMSAGEIYTALSGGHHWDWDMMQGTSEFLDGIGINGFVTPSDLLYRVAEPGSKNYVVFNEDKLTISGDIRFQTVPEKYKQRHRAQVQAAIKRGITVPDKVLEAYADEPWASSELADRKMLRSFSWLLGLAKDVNSPEDLRDLANEELQKQGFDVLHEKAPKDLEFYEKLIVLASSESKGAYVSKFMDIVNSDRQLRRMVSEIAEARDDFHGLGLPRFMWDLVAKAESGLQISDADLDMIRSYAVRNREKMAQAYYAGKGDMIALAQFGSEEMLYGEETPAKRALNASLVKDPEVRQSMLDGTITYARLVDYENQLQQEMAQLEGDNDALQRTIDRLNTEILEQREQSKEELSRLRERYRERTERIVMELREKQRERDEVRRERAYVENLAARMRRPVPAQTTSYTVGRKMNAVAEMVIPRRWYQMEETPEGRRRSKPDPERAAALLEYLADPDQDVDEFLDRIREFQGLTLSDFTTEQIRLLYSLTERIREQGRREMEAFLDAQRERRNQAAGKIIKEVLRGEPQKVFENIGSIEYGEEQKSGAVFNAQAMSLRPPRMILLMSGGKEGVMYDWYINKINAATDAEIREYSRRIKGGQAMMDSLGIKPVMLEKDISYNGVTMRTDDVLHLWIAMKNEKSQAAVIYGNRIARDVINGLTSQLTENQKRWGEYMLSDFEHNYKRLNDTFIADRNMDMGKEAYYFPMIRQDLDQMPLGDEFASQIAVRNAWRKGYAEKKFTIDRLDIADENQKPIRLGATQIWLEQVNKQEHYIASALLAKDLQYIADIQVLRDALKQKYGKRANSWLRKYVNDWANPTMYKSFDAVTRWMGVVRNNMAVAYLGINMLTVLKQAPSLAFYFRAANPMCMLKAASEMVLHPLETMRFVEQMDPQVAARSYDRLTNELKAYDPSKVVRGMKAIGRVSMKPIMWMDKAAVTTGWMAVYYNAKAKNMSDLEAAREAQKATLDSQPAGRPKDVAEMYRSNELANWFTMFTNQLNQIWNMYAFDIPNAIKQHEFAKLIGILTGVGISGVAIAYLSGWRAPEDPEDLPKEVATELFKNFLSAVPFLGNGLKSGYDKFYGAGLEIFPIAYTAGKLMADITGDQEKVGPDIVSLVEDLSILSGLPVTGVKRAVNVGRYRSLSELLGYGFTQYTRDD